ncbi:hypothetical protein IV102_01960 [bacterium]|nr:hypothetical protein [bacterium]
MILYSHHPQGRQLAQDLGISYLQSDEKPSLADSEWLARDLSAVHNGPVVLLAWVGFGPGGWQAVELVQQHLERYGFSSGEAGYLLRPECLTPAEREAARELPLTPKTRLWLDKSGGVEGRAALLPAASPGYDRRLWSGPGLGSPSTRLRP